MKNDGRDEIHPDPSIFGVDLVSTWDVVSVELPELKAKITAIQTEMK